MEKLSVIELKLFRYVLHYCLTKYESDDTVKNSICHIVFNDLTNEDYSPYKSLLMDLLDEERNRLGIDKTHCSYVWSPLSETRDLRIEFLRRRISLLDDRICLLESNISDK